MSFEHKRGFRPNPDITHLPVPGVAKEGPLAHRAGYDVQAQDKGTNVTKYDGGTPATFNPNDGEHIIIEAPEPTRTPSEKLKHLINTRKLTEPQIRGALAEGKVVQTPTGMTADAELILDPIDPQANPDQIRVTGISFRDRHDVRNGQPGKLIPDHPALRYAKELADGGNADAAGLLKQHVLDAQRELAKHVIEKEPELRRFLDEQGRTLDEVRGLSLSNLRGMRVAPDEKRMLKRHEKHVGINDYEERYGIGTGSASNQSSGGDNYREGSGRYDMQDALPHGQGRTLGPAPLKSLGEWGQKGIQR